MFLSQGSELVVFHPSPGPTRDALPPSKIGPGSCNVDANWPCFLSVSRCSFPGMLAFSITPPPVPLPSFHRPGPVLAKTIGQLLSVSGCPLPRACFLFALHTGADPRVARLLGPSLPLIMYGGCQDLGRWELSECAGCSFSQRHACFLHHSHSSASASFHGLVPCNVMQLPID